MKKVTIIAAFFVVFGAGQTSKVDSLQKSLTSQVGVDRYKALYLLSDELEDTYPKEALHYALEAIQLADSLGIRDSVSILYATAGYCHTLLGEFTAGLQYAFQALDHATLSGSQTEIATAHSTLGIINVYVGQYSTALHHHQEALRIREELGLTDQAIRTLNNIGVVYHNIGNYSKAIEFYKEVMRRRGKTVDTLAAIRFYHNVGYAEYMRGNIDTSQVYLDQALSLAKNVKYISGIAYSYYNLGLLSKHRGNLHVALKELNESLKHYESLGQKHGALQVLNAIGDTYYRLKDYPAAISTLLRSVQLARSIRSPEQLKASYETLYKVYDKTGQVEKSYHFFRLYSEAKDSLVNLREHNEIAELTASLQQARNMQEIQELRSEKLINDANLEKQYFRSLLLGGGVIVLVVIVVLLYQYIRTMKKNKIEMVNSYAKMELLNRELQERLNEIKTLSGLLPICAHCKKIRDDEGYWQQLEGYISHHTDAKFSHGICPDCRDKYFPDI